MMDLDEMLKSIDAAGDDSLYILWTNADPTAAELMVFMYAENSMKYHMWEHITIIIWGATTKLAAENTVIQDKIKMLQDLGVDFTACVTCAEELGVAQKLESMGVSMIKWLRPLTAILKNGKHLLTV